MFNDGEEDAGCNFLLNNRGLNHTAVINTCLLDEFK